MSMHRAVVQDAAIGVGVASTPKGLTAIDHPGCAAAIWQRKPLKSFQTWIDDLAPEVMPRARLVLQPQAVQAAMTDLVEAAGLPNSTERSVLVDDIAALAHIFAEVMHAHYLRLRLDVISTNACRKFHIDAVTARLICTYRGSGTQYGISTDGAHPKKIFDVPTGSPMILKGTLWPQPTQSGLLHRSPPIEGTGTTRLVLVLDPIDSTAPYTSQRIH